MDTLSPQALKDRLLGDAEFALLDVREQGTFSESHLLFAVCTPLSQLELLLGDLAPRRTTEAIVVDEAGAADGFGARAVDRLASLGYARVALLEGGIQGWANAGFELFSGVNVPSKAFGEFVEHTYETPRLAAEEVKAMLDAGRDMVIVDSRPYSEYHRMSIPTGIDMPGAELAYRIHDVAPNPETFVVVNCAGRTRSIIGTQSLINAGIPNPVAALKDGTMGWHLAGFEVDRGATRAAPAPTDAGCEKALAAAARVAARFEVPTVDLDTAFHWSRDEDRTTYLLDVRSPAEYVDGHMPGWRHAPGGQLVQATDEYVAVKNARIVLCDDVGVRATMTASWLIQMGWPEVHVLEGGLRDAGLVQGDHRPVALGEPAISTVTTSALSDALTGYAVIDVGPSNAFAEAHIPGAAWSARSRLGEALATIGSDRTVVLTSTDGGLAAIAAGDPACAGREVLALEGGTARWLDEGRSVESGLDSAIGPIDDVWYKPYEHRGAQERFMRDYLTWEVALVAQLERDGTTRFRQF